MGTRRQATPDELRNWRTEERRAAALHLACGVGHVVKVWKHPEGAQIQRMCVFDRKLIASGADKICLH